MSLLMIIASDEPLREVPLPSDFTLTIDVSRGIVDDGGRDDGFSITPVEPVLELPTEKAYFARLDWSYTPGRAEKIIQYLREHLESADEAELWHTWQNMDFDHRVRKAEIPIQELTADDLQELDQLEVWKEPLFDYCYRITRGEV